MGVGLEQLGGPGTTITFEDNASSPGGLGYKNADFAAAFPADFILNPGTNPAQYRCKVSITNGDASGTGGAKTSWLGTPKETVTFDSGKTYTVKSNGQANRWTEWGSILATAADGTPVGFDGMTVNFNVGTFTLGGNYAIHGCTIRNLAGGIQFNPGLVGLSTSFVDSKFELNGPTGFGSISVSIGTMVRPNIGGTGSGNNGRMTQFNCPTSVDPVICFPNGNAKVNTGGLVLMRNPRFVGPSSSFELHLILAGFFLNPRWSQTIQKCDTAVYEEWMLLDFVAKVNGVRQPGALVEIWDKFGALLVSTTTDSFGQLPTFLSALSTFAVGAGLVVAPFAGALCVRGNQSGTVQEKYPFTLRVNGDGAIGGYPAVTQTIDAQYSTFLAGAEKQFDGLGITVDLAAPAATADVDYYRGQDIPAMIDGFGQPITFSIYATKALVERRGVRSLRGFGTATAARETVAIIKTDSLPGIRIGNAVSTDGQTYYVARMRQTGDGALTELFLADSL